MIKLNILNIENFMETVNQCSGNIMLHAAGGEKLNLNRQYGIQQELQKQYEENSNCLSLTLGIDNPKDYIKIISYYAGDC